jgi:hypothetical protein
VELIDRAKSIEASARRLAKLVSLNAPGLIIEGERHLLLKKLISFPADAEYIATREDVDSKIREHEEEWLKKTGYFDDVIKELGLEENLDNRKE